MTTARQTWYQPDSRSGGSHRARNAVPHARKLRRSQDGRTRRRDELTPVVEVEHDGLSDGACQPDGAHPRVREPRREVGRRLSVDRSLLVKQGRERSAHPGETTAGSAQARPPLVRPYAAPLLSVHRSEHTFSDRITELSPSWRRYPGEALWNDCAPLATSRRRPPIRGSSKHRSA